MAHRSPRTRRSIALASAALLIAVVPQTADAGAPPWTFQVDMARSCISGYVGHEVSVDVTWKDAAGALRAAATVTANDLGNWQHCFGNAEITDPAYLPAIGDRLRARIGSRSRRFVIPPLSMSIHRVTDKIKGTAPAGDKVRLRDAGGCCGPDGGLGPVIRVWADSDGKWSYHLAGLDGDRSIWADWSSASGDRVSFGQHAPYLVVTIGSARFSGRARPGANVEVNLSVESMVVGTGSDSVDGRGTVEGMFTQGSELVEVVAGDRIDAPAIGSDAHWTIPNVSVSASKGSDVVHGKCSDTETVYRLIRISSPDGEHNGFAYDRAGPGPFDVDFTPGETSGFVSAVDIKAGYSVTLACVQETGDQVIADHIVP